MSDKPIPPTDLELITEYQKQHIYRIPTDTVSVVHWSWPVLDHGSVTLLYHYGSDEEVIRSARMSTNKGFQGWGEYPCESCGGLGEGEDKIQGDGDVYRDKCARCKGEGYVVGDEKLLRYLYTHHHMTPFEMCGAVFEIAAPIFVFREWHRHRTQSYNELSARYTPLPDVNYVPTLERCQMVSSKNKQATNTTGKPLDDTTAAHWLGELQDLYDRAQSVYQRGLDIGIPKELARLPVPVARYSRMRAAANLRNWLQFLTLRMDTAAQYEIRQYANVICTALTSIFPRTMELFIHETKPTP